MSEFRRLSPFAEAPALRRHLHARVPACHCAGRCHCGGLVPALLMQSIERDCEFYRTEL